MRIPIIKAEAELPRIPVTATTQGAGQEGRAMAELGGVVQRIGLDLAETQQRIRMSRELAQAELDMEAANRDIVANLKLKADPDTYVQDWANQFQEITARKLENVKGVRTRAAVEQLFSRIATREIGQQKDYANKLWIETEQTEVAKALQGYAAEGRFQDGMKLIDSAKELYSPKELLTLKGTFKASYDAIQKELADVAADQAIMKDPKQAVIDLKTKTYLPNLEPMQRQDKVEKARAAAKVWDNEQEMKLKEAEIAAKDEEEREIANKFMAGDYKDAFNLTLISTRLSGPEKRVWSNAIDSASSGKSIHTDYTLYRKLSLQASEGLIKDPTELYSLIDKGLTIENVNQLKTIIADAEKPEKEFENNAVNTAIQRGNRQILKPDPLSISSFLGESEHQAHLFESALRRALEKEQDYKKRLEMVDPEGEYFNRLLQTYDVDITTPSTSGKKRKTLTFYD